MKRVFLAAALCTLVLVADGHAFGRLFHRRSSCGCGQAATAMPTYAAAPAGDCGCGQAAMTPAAGVQQVTWMPMRFENNQWVPAYGNAPAPNNNATVVPAGGVMPQRMPGGGGGEPPTR